MARAPGPPNPLATLPVAACCSYCTPLLSLPQKINKNIPKTIIPSEKEKSRRREGCYWDQMCRLLVGLVSLRDLGGAVPVRVQGRDELRDLSN